MKQRNPTWAVHESRQFTSGSAGRTAVHTPVVPLTYQMAFAPVTGLRRSGWPSPFMSDRHGAPHGSIRSRRSVTIDERGRGVDLVALPGGDAGTSGPSHPSYDAHDIAQRRRGGPWGEAQRQSQAPRQSDV